MLFIPGFNVRQPSRKRTIFDVWCSDPYLSCFLWPRSLLSLSPVVGPMKVLASYLSFNCTNSKSAALNDVSPPTVMSSIASRALFQKCITLAECFV